MIELELDGKKVEVAEGSTVIQAAEKAQTYIPHFCYHKKLSIAASCRMCLVDIEKMPKPMPACATPVAQGMVVRTRSAKAVNAQKSVMEFLLINHPLDCPICDQGGECQLQDLAVGYGGDTSRYEEEKRVVQPKDVGPLISMQEMSRCIHCTRCVRFGQEIAGVMELGMSHRGEHSEIETFLGQSVDSELSGNMIDICPVGALTSKPFRYQARTWELARRKSVSPHDSTGANLIVQVKNDRVLRVVPFENDDVNECWLADRDRFSYEGLNTEDRLTKPMLKQGGVWHEVDWEAALKYVVHGVKHIKDDHGANAVAALVSPHATLEEMALMSGVIRGLGSDSVDYRLRHAELSAANPGVQSLGMPIAALSKLQRVLLVGSDVRHDHPLLAARIRAAARAGCAVHAIHSVAPQWAMRVGTCLVERASQWVSGLAQVAAAVASARGVTPPVAVAAVSDSARAIAASLLEGERKAILLGNAALHHGKASSLLALARWIAEQTGATWGVLPEAANTVGAQLLGAVPQGQGLHAGRILAGEAKAVFLLHAEPSHDAAGGAAGLEKAEMVVTLSPYKSNMDISDVLLPIAPFTETPGTFVNAEGRVQSFYAVVKPLGETRPAWKVLRVLGEMLGLSGFTQDSAQQVLAGLAFLRGDAGALSVDPARLQNQAGSQVDLAPWEGEPVVAPIYGLDPLVRRAASLQHTAQARRGERAEGAKV